MKTSRLLTATAPVVAAAGVGGYGSRRAPEIYARLRKPSWAPPSSAFGPVWSALYVTIAVVGYRIAGPSARRDRVASGLQLTQLALNGAWPVAFFGRRDKRISLGIITALDVALAAEIARLARIDRASAALLLPYAAWTGFATALNASVSDPQVEA